MSEVKLGIKIDYLNKPFIEEFADSSLWAYRELFADKTFIIHQGKVGHSEIKAEFNTNYKIIDTVLKIASFSIKWILLIPGILLGVLPKFYAQWAYDEVKENHQRVNDYVQQLKNKQNIPHEHSCDHSSHQLDNNQSYTFEELMNSPLDKDILFQYAKDRSNAPKEKLALMIKTANMEHAEAMFLVGQIYRYGLYYTHDRKEKEIEINITEAITWLQKAANAGFHNAFAYLATIYFYGEGVSEDKVEAKKWLLQGFEKGAKFLSLQGKMSQVFGNSEQVVKFFHSYSH